MSSNFVALVWSDICKELAKSKIRRETIKSWKNREISCFLSRLNSLEEFYFVQ